MTATGLRAPAEHAAPEPPGFQRPLLGRLGRYRASRDLRRHLCAGAVLYTSCDEDSRSELDALCIGPSDRVLSVTGSGCRSLNLLLANPRSLVTVDANPVQNHLLELKVAAMRHLDHAGFLRFIGIRRDDRREATYRAIRTDMSDAAAAFWDLNSSVIARGVIFSGAHETYYRRTLGVFLGLRPRLVRRLFEIRDLAEQRAFYHRRWNTPAWRAAISGGTSPAVYRMILPDPSYIAHVKLGEPVGRYLLRRFEHTLTNHLARDNHWISLLFLGRYHNERAMPPYLTAEHYQTVRSRLGALEIVTAGLGDHLASSPSASFDAFSLSDISGWSDQRAFESLLSEAVRCGRPAARLCYRNFLTKRLLPAALLERVEPLRDVAERLDHSDRTFAYTFQVGQVLDDGEMGSR